MTIVRYLAFMILLCGASARGAQQDSTQTVTPDYPARELAIEPAIGINPWPMSDLLVSTLLQWHLDRHWSIVSFSSYAYNNAFLRAFNYIKTNYNYSLSQKFGVGFSLYWGGSSHTFSFIGGIKYDAFKETLENPAFESVSASIHAVSPDCGILYNWKTGRGNMFFSFRMYLPLYPYPMKTLDQWALDGNMANLSLECGIGFCLR